MVGVGVGLVFVYGVIQLRQKWLMACTVDSSAIHHGSEKTAQAVGHRNRFTQQTTSSLHHCSEKISAKAVGSGLGFKVKQTLIILPTTKQLIVHASSSLNVQSERFPFGRG